MELIKIIIKKGKTLINCIKIHPNPPLTKGGDKTKNLPFVKGRCLKDRGILFIGFYIFSLKFPILFQVRRLFLVFLFDHCFSF